MLELTLPSDFFEKEEKTQLSVQISEALLPQVEIQGGDLQSTFAFNVVRLGARAIFPPCYVIRTGESRDSRATYK